MFIQTTMKVERLHLNFFFFFKATELLVSCTANNRMTSDFTLLYTGGETNTAPAWEKQINHISQNNARLSSLQALY